MNREVEVAIKWERAALVVYQDKNLSGLPADGDWLYEPDASVEVRRLRRHAGLRRYWSTAELKVIK